MNNTPTFSHRRLQRERDFTGDRLSTFRDMLLRHGLPGLAIAIVFIAIPDLQFAFFQGIERAIKTPTNYAIWAIAIFFTLNAYAWWIDRQWSLPKLGWIAYLGVLSLWEEWVFRVAIPQSLEGVGLSVWTAIAISALIFGGVHYFTLRWKWQWCVGAFVGSLALSRQMELHNDLLLITAFHWIATFLNTPRPPGQSTNSIRQ